MIYRYITALFTDDFLPGVLVLNQSLINVGSNNKLLVLVTPNITDLILKILENAGIDIRPIDVVPNPNTHLKENVNIHNYSKLNIFDLTEYDKIVYLDADTFVCNNVDELFQKPHMSAVNTGGMLPELSDWTEFNAGVLVVKPDGILFENFMEKKNLLPSKGGGDQGFLQSYYFDWPNRKELHLCHGYNMYVEHISRYEKLFGYILNPQMDIKNGRQIKIIHFWRDMKPWYLSSFDMFKGDERLAFELWYKAAYQVVNVLSVDSIIKLCTRFPELNDFINKKV